MSQTANFFGVGDNCQEDQAKWRRRQSRALSRRHGGIKQGCEPAAPSAEDPFGLPLPHIVDPLGKCFDSLCRFTNTDHYVWANVKGTE